jgi:hypothetical protein
MVGANEGDDSLGFDLVENGDFFDGGRRVWAWRARRGNQFSCPGGRRRVSCPSACCPGGGMGRHAGLRTLKRVFRPKYLRSSDIISSPQ